MRKTTLLSLVLALFCGTGIFHTSQKVHDEREKIATIEAAIGKEEESLRVLNAEWSYLNQPTRLEKLAKTYLHMVPMKGGQFVKVENIPLRSATVAEAAPTPEEKKAEEKKVEEKKTAKPQITAIKMTKYPHPSLLPKGEGTRSTPPLPLGEGRGEGTSTPKVKAASNAKPPATPRNFSDLMKNLHAGIE